MKVSELRAILKTNPTLTLVLPDGNKVAPSFHITEAGLTTKQFVDCGGMLRSDKKINLQVWEGTDLDHRLEPSKLIRILDIAEPIFQQQDLEVTMEYNTDTLGVYGLTYQDGVFHLLPTHTDCLAKENCGIPPSQQKAVVAGAKEASSSSCCSPEGGCC